MDKRNTLSSGLNNLGNTCFFNAVLQMLYQCTVLNNLILTNNFEGKLINLYQDFLKTYINSKNSFSPTSIIQYTTSTLGRNGLQCEDAEQYLNYIIDTLIDELLICVKKYTYTLINKQLTVESLIKNLFTIKIKKTITCPLCNYVTESNDDINKFYLSFTSRTRTMNDMINDYLNETLDNDNKWKCDNCNKYVNAHIIRDIVKMPKYLIIVVKRYDNNNNKINTSINMSNKIILNSEIFYTRGIIYHEGSTNGGHYTYFGNKGSMYEPLWYHYNDASVTQVINIVTTGYVYLYVKK